MLLCAACAETTPVEFTIRAKESANPLLSATSVVVGLEREELFLEETEAIYPPHAATLDLPKVALGEGYRFRVGVYDGDILLARARSFEFEVNELGIVGSPGLFLAPLGRFVMRELPQFERPRVAIPSPRGLLAALEDGSVVELRVHEPESLISILPRGSALEAWAAGERLLIRLGDERLALVGAEGILDVIQERRLRHHLLAGSLYDEMQGALYLIGGTRGSKRISRIHINEKGFGELEALAEMDSPRSDADLILLRGLDGSTALVVAGGFAGGSDGERVFHDDLLLLNLDGEPHRRVPLPEGVSLYGATVTRGAYLQLLIAGGRREEGLSAETQLLVVNPRSAPHLELVSPSPAPLHIARARAKSVSWAPGLHLIYGGFNAEGVYEPRAELVDLREIPGSTAPTDALPLGFQPSIAIALRDGSILMSDGAGSAAYTPPRAYD